MLIEGRVTKKSAKSIPVVVTNLSSIAATARRLGMLWKTFDIHRSIFHAEGNGMVMTTAVARSSVTVIQFDSGGRKMSASFPLDQIYIPSEDADRLGFGIITTWYKDPKTNEPDRFVMHPEDRTPDLKLIAFHHDPWYHMTVFPDIVPFASRMLHGKGSLVTRIPKPHDLKLGLTSNELSVRLYFGKLQDLRNAHPEWSQLRWLCETYKHLTISHGDWTRGKSGEGFLDDIHDQYDKTTSYFDNLEDRQNLRYRDLMYCHFELGVRPDSQPEDSHEAGFMRAYFNVLPDLHKAMAKRGYSGTESQVTEAWATMIFRGICWNCCHSMVEGERVPSRIWGSRLPVYIG